MTKAESKPKKGPIKKRAIGTNQAARRDTAQTKSAWTQAEDESLLEILSDYDLEREGKIKWKSISTHIRTRNSKQVRERWLNHLRPDLTKGKWSDTEEVALFELQSKLGNKWKAISQILQRSENDVKNRWNSKGYSRYHKILSSGSLDTTTAMLKERTATMTGPELAANVASLQKFQGIPEEILSHFRMSRNIHTDGKRLKIHKSDSIPVETEAKMPADASMKQLETRDTTKMADLIDDRMQEDDDPIAGLVAYERSRWLPHLTATPSLSWGDSSFGNFDVPSPFPINSFMGSARSAFQSPAHAAYDAAIFRVTGRGAGFQDQESPLLPFFQTPNVRSSPVQQPRPYVEKRNFSGRTFFSPGVKTGGNHDDLQMTSPFGTSHHSGRSS